MNELRNKQYTINLTETESKKIEELAKKERRKTREFLYILVSDTLASK